MIEIAEQSIEDIIASFSEKHELNGVLHIVLANSKSKIVQVEKPSVPEDEILSALTWQVKDLVNIPPENILLDYFDGPTLAGTQKINVVCVTRSEVVELASELIARNLNIATITTEEFAFASLLPVQANASLLVCQQPNEEINLLIIKEGQVFFARRLRGFEKISHQNQTELSMGVLDSLSLEIQRSTDYFERQLKQAPIKDIQVLIPIENEQFLAQKLSENTNVAVTLFAMPDYAKNQRHNAVAVGATQLNFMEPNKHG